VLIIAVDGSLLPVDVRAERPADWKVGAVFTGKWANGYIPMIPLAVAYADGRLFVSDHAASAVRMFDVALDPTAVAAPISKAGARLLAPALWRLNQPLIHPRIGVPLLRDSGVIRHRSVRWACIREQ
jgi:hypothetical protein